MENQGISIGCSKFQEKEPEIEGLTGEINQTRGREKLRWARKLKTEVEPLLACEEYNPKSLECQSCRLISQTRKKTAETIVKVLDLT